MVVVYAFVLLFFVWVGWICLRLLSERRKFSPQAAARAAQKWLTARIRAVLSGLGKLEVLKQRLQEDSLWRSEDERRFSKVVFECSDYLASIAQALEANFRNQNELFAIGPSITVPTSLGAGSLAQDADAVDAHIELLTIQAQTRLRLARYTAADVREYLEKFLVEIDHCVDEAGFNSIEKSFRRYQMENLVRQVTGLAFVRFETAPFGLSAARALAEVRVTQSPPQIEDFLPVRFGDTINSGNTADGSESAANANVVFDNYKTALQQAWRPLSVDECAAVLAKLKLGETEAV